MENLTENAVQALMRSCKIAARFASEDVREEHVLIALCRDETCIATRALKRAGVDAARLITTIEPQLPAGAAPRRLGARAALEKYTPSAVRFLSSIARSARWRGREGCLGTEHILLWMLSKEGGFASRLLESMGVESKGVEAAVKQVLQEQGREQIIEGSAQPILVLEEDWEPREEEEMHPVTAAHKEAVRLYSPKLRTEHMLLALLREPENTAARVLRSFSVDIDRIIVAIDQQALPPANEEALQHMSVTASLKKVLACAVHEARDMHCSNLDSGHLLLGLLHAQKGLAANVLREHKLDIDAVREAVARELRK